MKMIVNDKVTKRQWSISPTLETDFISIDRRMIRFKDYYGDSMRTHSILFDTLDEMEQFARDILEKIEYSA